MDFLGVGGTMRSRVIGLCLFLLAVTILFPLVWMILCSLKDKPDLHSWPPTLLPKRVTFQNYMTIIERMSVPRYFWNSLVTTGIPVLTNLTFASIAGFIFAKYRFPGRDVVFLFILVTMAVPQESMVVPLYILTAKLNWINTYVGIVYLSLLGPFSTFLIRQHISTIPDDCLEAAVVEGCGFLKILRMIIIPMIRPALATVATFVFMWNWRSLLWPLIIAETASMHTLEVGLASFSYAYYTDWGPYMAFASLLVIPVAALFLALKKYFIKGLASML